MNPSLPNRRDFLRIGLATAGAAAFDWPSRADTDSTGMIMTVKGPISPGELGMTLPHEHVLVDFVGADRVSPRRYDSEEAYAVILPHLRRARELGCRSMVECTPAWLGRDVKLLVKLSEASGLRLLTNTGYYGAGKGKYLPRHAFEESADALAARWLAEWRDGIEGTGVRPGFVKIGVDAGPLSAVNRKIVQAAARTHSGSGLTIAGHTGDGAAAFEQLEILRQEGVGSSAWIWVHAQSEPNWAMHLKAAEQGAWISLDGVAPGSVERHVEIVANLKRGGFLPQVLISHDAGWYAVGEPNGGKYRGYETLFESFLPALRQAGFTEAEIAQLTVTNPAKAFSIGVRKA